LYAGSSPAGLFRSEDGGATWEPVAVLSTTIRCGRNGPGIRHTGRELLHSVLIDPRDAKHLSIGISVGGIFESATRAAAGRRSTWVEGGIFCRHPTPSSVTIHT